jgi:glycosyltransferase involved in cell wall biosynthesis
MIPRTVTVRTRVLNVRRRLAGQPALGAHQFPIHNANRVDERRYDRRALLVYLPSAFHWEPGSEEFRKHQNLRRTRMMASILDENGFVVDVANKRDGHFRGWPPYDLVISERHWQSLAELAGDAPSAFLATSHHHRVHNRKLNRRHDLREARGRTPLPRTGLWPEGLEALTTAHAIVGNGNRTTAESWEETFSGPTYWFDAFPPGDRHEAPSGKDREAARRSFLFFASRNQMRKGLDLALEGFAQTPELELHVCSNVEREEDFARAYARDLAAPNVTVHGWTDVQGDHFAELVRRCGWVLHPSCSEGQAGAVVQCMASGLVPVLTPETGLDVDGFGSLLHEETPEALAELVRACAETDAGELGDRAAAAYDVAHTRHTEDAFAERFRGVVGALAPR